MIRISSQMEMKVMEEQKKKITANDTIIGMVNYINLDKKDLFYILVQNYTDTLSKTGNLYYRMKRLISQKPKKFIELDNLSNDLKKLINQHLITIMFF